MAVEGHLKYSTVLLVRDSNAATLPRHSRSQYYVISHPINPHLPLQREAAMQDRLKLLPSSTQDSIPECAVQADTNEAHCLCQIALIHYQVNTNPEILTRHLSRNLLSFFRAYSSASRRTISRNTHRENSELHRASRWGIHSWRSTYWTERKMRLDGSSPSSSRRYASSPQSCVSWLPSAADARSVGRTSGHSSA